MANGLPRSAKSNSHIRRRRAPGSSIHPVDQHVGQQVRIHYRLSQGDLAHGVGVSTQQVQKYESGKNRISAFMLYEIATFLGISPTIFFDGLEQDSSEERRLDCEASERIAYLATADGSTLIDNMLRLPPRVRIKIQSVIAILAEE